MMMVVDVVVPGASASWRLAHTACPRFQSSCSVLLQAVVIVVVDVLMPRCMWNGTSIVFVTSTKIVPTGRQAGSRVTDT